MTSTTKLRVAILRGGPSAEHDVSLNSGKNVLENIDSERFIPIDVIIGQDEIWAFEDGSSLTTGPALEHLKQIADVAFLALHGQWGEDGTVQTLLERAGIPYTGSGPEASAWAMDKARANDAFIEAGLSVPNFLVVTHASWIQFGHDLAHKIETNIEYPLVVKPANLGSSVGVTIVEEEDKLNSAMTLAFLSSDMVIIQRFISGREITCAVLETPDGTAEALPPTEIKPKVAKFFDYEAKYQVGGSEEITPAPLSDTETANLQGQALKAHAALGCRGMSRSDLIFDRDDKWWILETNTIPGLTATSLLPQAAAAAGIDFTTLISRIIERATSDRETQ